ncbi:MAG: ABC transporter permease [Candidatus Tectomicrobia bacterium]|nr:ABC transporter permease [Candidatus Tectomicrobia bacterium]
MQTAQELATASYEGTAWRTKVRLWRAALIVALLLVWQVLSSTKGALWFSSPVAIVARFWEELLNLNLLIDAGITLAESVLGFVIGAALGLGLPFILRLFPRLAAVLDPYITAAMGVPKLAMAPLLILWFGIDMTSKVVFVVIVVCFLIFFNTYAGVRAVDPNLIKVARIFGANQKQISRHIVWPTASPYVFAGMKISLPRSISAAVVGEFLSPYKGLGSSIDRARSMFDMTGVILGVLVVTILIMLVDVALSRVQSRSLAWREEETVIGI